MSSDDLKRPPWSVDDLVDLNFTADTLSDLKFCCSNGSLFAHRGSLENLGLISFS